MTAEMQKASQTKAHAQISLFDSDLKDHHNAM